MFACLLAVGFYPLYERIQSWVQRRGLAALLSTLLIYVVILLPLAFVATTVAAEISEQFAKLKAASVDDGGIGPHLQSQMDDLTAWIAPRMRISDEELRAQITSQLNAAAQWMGKAFALGLVFAGSTIVNGVLAAIILFFLLREGRRIPDTIMAFLPLRKEDSSELIAVISDTLIANLYGVIGVALAQGVLVGVGLAIAGISSPFTWGVVAAFCSMLPVVGPTLAWVPAAVWLFATGSYGSATFLVIWGVLVVGLADNILRPLLVSGTTNQHPLLIFVSMLGGTSAFGIMGLFLGPLLISVTLAVLKVFRREMLSQGRKVLEFSRNSVARTNRTDLTRKG
jgi:predicted PurR-regulated permease PerM